MKERLAKLISEISSPFLMVFVFGLWAVAGSVSTAKDFLIFGGLCILLISFLPFLYILLQIKLGNISDIHVAVREQRSGPFIIATCGAVILALLYHFLSAPKELIALAIALIVSGTVFGVISGFWKVSIHAAAYTGAVVIVAFIINFSLLWLLVLLPVIIWARLIRKRHSVSQAIVASLLNAVCVATTLSLLLH
jgi:hypothetical protein